MRNYVIINGVSSLTIEGLAINIMPPITKPLMRNEIEEIDGRDGDIITELGYSAYDKEMEIGLWGNYDIDEIIKFFTGEGTVIFSTEPDKYYNFKILDQIDYEKLLKFRTATVVFHCQPFKYPTNEEPIEVEPVVKTGEGETITIDDTYEGNLEMLLKGNTYQDSTSISGGDAYDSPTPEHPQEVHVVSGDNEVEVVGKNLLNRATCTENIILTWAGGVPYANTGSLTSDFIRANVSETIQTNHDCSVFCYDKTKNYLGNISPQGTLIKTSSGLYSNNWQIPNVSEIYYIRIVYNKNVGGNTNILTDNVMVNKGSSLLPYEEYAGATYPINLPEGMFLGSIGDYKDRFFKTSGNNLYQGYYATRTNQAITFTHNTNGDITASGTASGNAYSVALADAQKFTLQTGTYTLSGGLTNAYLQICDSSGNVISTTSSNSTQTSFTLSSNTLVYLRVQVPSGTNINSGITLFPMLNEGETALPYEPYGSNEWYLEKKIGKVVLDGTENWRLQSATAGQFGLNNSTVTNNTGYCDNFIVKTSYVTTGKPYFRLANGVFFAEIGTEFLSEVTVSAWTTWLSTHNTEVYYVLSTPTYTKIEGTLASQLEEVYRAKSEEGQTNISQTNDDLPFWISATITFTPPSTINNIGNIYAKPILTITGSGNVGVVLNGIEILQINLGEGNTIAIDVPNLEAYNPNDNTLMNRLVTGDYMKLLIQEGNNSLSFDGDVTSYSMTNYTRWI